mgnify:FL=1
MGAITQFQWTSDVDTWNEKGVTEDVAVVCIYDLLDDRKCSTDQTK